MSVPEAGMGLTNLAKGTGAPEPVKVGFHRRKSVELQSCPIS